MIRTRGNAKYETVVTVIGEKQVTKKGQQNGRI